MRQFRIKLKLEMFAFEAVNPAWITRRKTFTSQRQEQETEQTNPTRGIEAQGHINKPLFPSG